MSRTRIVRGKITEIVGGDLTYFSESSISEYAAEVYSENSKTLIKHTGSPQRFSESKSKTYKYPILILQGSRRKGKNRENTGTASDMLYADYPETPTGFQRLRTQLYDEVYKVEKQDSWYDWSSRGDNATGQADSKIEKVKEYCEKSDSDLFEIFKSDIGYFSMGKLQQVAESMVDKMQTNTGGEFTNTDLTEAVIAHTNSINFISAIKRNITEYLSKNSGEISGLEIKDDSKGILYDMLVEDNVSSPKFSDKFGGLGITINDVWAYQVYITNYRTKENYFQMELEYIYWDHFGLDYPDIQKYNQDIFFAWFVLQHFKGYKPFITKVDIVGKHTGFF
jgi:uncharacterized protein (TIGR03034 family)